MRLVGVSRQRPKRDGYAFRFRMHPAKAMAQNEAVFVTDTRNRKSSHPSFLYFLISVVKPRFCPATASCNPHFILPLVLYLVQCTNPPLGEVVLSWDILPGR